MVNLRELYKKLNNTTGKDFFGQVKNAKSPYYNPLALDCLLNPQKHLHQIRDEHKTPCYEIFEHAEKKLSQIKLCGSCENLSETQSSALQRVNNSADSVESLKLVKSERLTFALIAPAFLGQFEGADKAGILRAALKSIGFDGMIEVSLFADILTLKEAFEFDRNIKNESDYQLTSCCCPMWIAMIKKIYSSLMPHMPASVSPMIASGRVIKLLYPDAATVFIGPCIAKKAEAREPDIAGAIDRVLTFSEVKDIFAALGVNPSDFPSIDKDHSSYSGRIYARRKGVSEAIECTIKRINPERDILPKAEHADGVASCKLMLNSILEGKASANFFEGMGCAGGCVGGPKACIPVETATDQVNGYAALAPYKTPIDNAYIIELLHRIGIDTDDDLLESDIFSRKF